MGWWFGGSAAILTLDVLPICRISFYFFIILFFFPCGSFLHFFVSLAAMQQTILLRVNNCNNLGLIDALLCCNNAEVSPPAAVRAAMEGPLCNF